MGEIGFLLIAIVVVMVGLVYALRLQRQGVATQASVVESHLAEGAQRQRQFLAVEQSLELQKAASAQAAETLELLRRAAERDEQALVLLKRFVALQEEILLAIRESRRQQP